MTEDITLNLSIECQVFTVLYICVYIVTGGFVLYVRMCLVEAI